jgi:hypothetical protein
LLQSAAVINQQQLCGDVLKLRFCYIQVQFFNLVLWLGGRITEASPAASRRRKQQLLQLKMKTAEYTKGAA